MTNLKTNNNKNTEFMILTDQELMETEGGVILETAAAITVVKWTAAGVGLIFASGVFVGYTNAKRP